MKVIDHSVSGETFALEYDDYYKLYHTTPIPENLGSYYQSEAYISHTDGSKGLFEKLYQWVKHYTLQRKGWYATGVEPEAKARDRAGEKGVFLYESQEQLTEKYDVITLWHVLEHIPQLKEQILFLKNHLEKEGLLVIAVPNYLSRDAQHYGPYWAAYDVPRHLWHFSQESIRLLFEEKGFELIGVKPMPFDAFYVSLLSEKYKSGKMNFTKGFYHGLLSNLSALRTGEYSSLIYLLKVKSKR